VSSGASIRASPLVDALESLCRGTLTDGTGTVYRTAYSHFQLNNCGANIPVFSGIESIVQDLMCGLHLRNYRHDQILCGNVKSTYYTVTPMKDAPHPLRDGEAFVICSATTT
jgi:hypothetical protein